MKGTFVSQWARVYRQNLATFTARFSDEMLLIELSSIPIVVRHKFDLSARHPGLRKTAGPESMYSAYNCRLWIQLYGVVVHATASPEQYASEPLGIWH